MPTKYRIQLRRATDGSEEWCCGDISDADWELFITFRNYASDLRTAEWIKSGLNTEYSVSAKEDGPLVVDVPNRPSDAAVRELLHLLRPFLLQKERTYFPVVLSRLRPYLDHPYLQRLIAQWSSAFSGKATRDYFTIHANDLEITDDRSLMMWLNAFEYHRDEEKRARFLELHGGPPEELTLAVFRDSLATKAEAILRAANFITALEQAPSARDCGPARSSVV